jgi:hypothetical protein
VTTIPEKKGEVDVIAGFLVIALGFAAWRGGEGAPIVAGILAIIAIGILVAWLNWRRKPTPMLAISPEEIFYGRLDQPGMRINRDASGRLAFRRGFRNSGLFLLLADAPDQPGISMIGFDATEVARACVAHGWTFE